MAEIPSNRSVEKSIYRTKNSALEIVSQIKADFGYVPNPVLKSVFMATAVDLVDDQALDAIHPRYKEDVGKRLSLGALNLAYNISVEYSAPRVIKAVYADNSTLKITYGPVSGLQFDFHIRLNTDQGFEVCCDAQTCYKDSEDNWRPISMAAITFVDSSISFAKPTGCSRPMYIRYNWRQKPCEFKSCPLYTLGSNFLPFNTFIIEVKQTSR
jgi:sialate O-acetylesterase